MPILNYTNGTYAGDVLDGVEHGTGTFTWNNGNSYSGNWVNGSQTGEGAFVFAQAP